jgi:beta-phosphoglucomutase family hydrolase
VAAAATSRGTLRAPRSNDRDGRLAGPLTLRRANPAGTRRSNRSPSRIGRTVAAVLGLPDDIRACLFDLDGVLTQTAKVHQAAWKRTFDEFLRQRDPAEPEFSAADYNRFVDGKPRKDGVRDFLASRGITLPEGADDDPADAPTVSGVATRKNELLLRELEEHGVEVYDGSMRYLRAVKDAGLSAAVVTASANGGHVIEVAGFGDLIDARIDGLVTAREGLRGKPAPDTFLAGARALDVAPAQAAVFEDALSGVAAGRAGDFGFVVGVDRAGQAQELAEHGADLVVRDLAELMGEGR